LRNNLAGRGNLLNGFWMFVALCVRKECVFDEQKLSSAQTAADKEVITLFDHLTAEL
jgi:hypothetical protein